MPEIIAPHLGERVFPLCRSDAGARLRPPGAGDVRVHDLGSPAEILEKWRALERRLAADETDADEQVALLRTIDDLRHAYHQAVEERAGTGDWDDDRLPFQAKRTQAF
jgi:hypothetical protein